MPRSLAGGCFKPEPSQATGIVPEGSGFFFGDGPPQELRRRGVAIRSHPEPGTGIGWIW